MPGLSTHLKLDKHAPRPALSIRSECSLQYLPSEKLHFAFGRRGGRKRGTWPCASTSSPGSTATPCLSSPPRSGRGPGGGVERLQHTAQARHKPRLELAREFMFPETKHPPPGRPQSPRHQPVSRLVRGEFRSPERRVVARLRGVERTAMPETTVHEHGHTQLGENKIRTNTKGSFPLRSGERAGVRCSAS